MEVAGRLDTDTHFSSTEEILCQPCLSDDESVPAEAFCETCSEHFCSSCLKFHRKQAITKHHVIKSKDEMPRIQVQNDKCLQICEIHSKEIVKFYCKSHKEVGCGDCMVLKHKACEVHLVTDIPHAKEKRKDINNIKDGLEHLQREIVSQLDEIKNNIKTAEEDKTKVMKEISLFRFEFNSYRDRVEDALRDEVEVVYAKEISKQSAAKAEYEQIENEMKDLQDTLSQNAEKVNHLFVTAKFAQKRLQMHEESIKRLKSNSYMNTLMFEPSKEFVSLKISGSLFGKLTIDTGKATMRKLQAKFARRLNGKAKIDTLQCSFTGAALVSQHELVLADYNNGTIKLLSIPDDKITSVYKSDHSPWDVCSIQPDSVAVTIPSTGMILFIQIKNGLSATHNFEVRQGCIGIDFQNGVFAVSFTSPPAIQILNLNGDILHAVANTTNLFRFPCHVALSKDIRTVFVSDIDANTVYELTIDGKLVAEMKGDFLKRPRGITLASDGTLVCGSQGSGRCLTLIAPGTRDIQPMKLKDIDKVSYAIICDEQLYVCEDFNSARREEISVFDLKEY